MKNQLRCHFKNAGALLPRRKLLKRYKLPLCKEKDSAIYAHCWHICKLLRKKTADKVPAAVKNQIHMKKPSLCDSLGVSLKLLLISTNTFTNTYRLAVLVGRYFAPAAASFAPAAAAACYADAGRF